MFKIVRNTLFTIAVVALTALGLRWHSQVAKSQSFVTAGATVLAGETFNSDSPNFPLTISFNSPQVRLGQAETVTITTLPGVHLDVVTQYPDGSTNHDDTFQEVTSSSGSQSFTITIGDFHNLGLVRISAVATSGTKSSQAIGQFQVTPWEMPTAVQTGGYVYPLVP